MLLALYTSGKAFEQAEIKKFMVAAPKTLDDFYAGLQALSDAVWEAGPPLWAVTPALASKQNDAEQLPAQDTPPNAH